MTSFILVAIMVCVFLAHWRASIILTVIFNSIFFASLAFGGEDANQIIGQSALALLSQFIPGGGWIYVIGTMIIEFFIAKAPIKPNSTIELGVHFGKGLIETVKGLKRDKPAGPGQQ